MTRETGSLEFAHARISARWGERPGDELWRRIQTTRPLAAVLGLARGSSLARWLGGLDASSDLHRIDRRFREAWRERVSEVAGWMPLAWQPALQGWAALAELPVWQCRVQGRPLPRWVADDPALAPLAQTQLPQPGPTLLGDAVLRPAPPARLLEQATAAWLHRLPPVAGRPTIVEVFLPLLQRHLQAFAAPQAVDGWGLRRGLEQRLALLWRRHPAEPVGAFVHLALVALEGERLRGELARRAAFPDRGLAT